MTKKEKEFVTVSHNDEVAKIEGAPGDEIKGRDLMKAFGMKKGDRLYRVHPMASMPDVLITGDRKECLREGAVYYSVEANRTPKTKPKKES